MEIPGKSSGFALNPRSCKNRLAYLAPTTAGFGLCNIQACHGFHLDFILYRGRFGSNGEAGSPKGAFFLDQFGRLLARHAPRPLDVSG